MPFRKPVLQIPPDGFTNLNTPFIFSKSYNSAITIADGINSQFSHESLIKLHAKHGKVTLSRIEDLVFVTGSGYEDNHVVFAGSPQAIDNALEGMTFIPDHNFFGKASLKIVLDDEGHIGRGKSVLTSHTWMLQVTPLLSGKTDNVSVQPFDGSFIVYPQLSSNSGFTYKTELGQYISVVIKIEENLPSKSEIIQAPILGKIELMEEQFRYIPDPKLMGTDIASVKLNGWLVNLIIQLINHESVLSNTVDLAKGPSQQIVIAASEEIPKYPAFPIDNEEYSDFGAQTIAAFAIQNSEKNEFDLALSEDEEENAFEDLRSLFKDEVDT